MKTQTWIKPYKSRLWRPVSIPHLLKRIRKDRSQQKGAMECESLTFFLYKHLTNPFSPLVFYSPSGRYTYVAQILQAFAAVPRIQTAFQENVDSASSGDDILTERKYTVTSYRIISTKLIERSGTQALSDSFGRMIDEPFSFYEIDDTAKIITEGSERNQLPPLLPTMGASKSLLWLVLDPESWTDFQLIFIDLFERAAIPRLQGMAKDEDEFNRLREECRRYVCINGISLHSFATDLCCVPCAAYLKLKSPAILQIPLRRPPTSHSSASLQAMTCTPNSRMCSGVPKPKQRRSKSWEMFWRCIWIGSPVQRERFGSWMKRLRLVSGIGLALSEIQMTMQYWYMGYRSVFTEQCGVGC